MKELECIIPIQEKEKCDEINLSMGTNFKDTDWHVSNFFDNLNNLIQECGDEGGWYIGDAIKVSVKIEYNPEDK